MPAYKKKITVPMDFDFFRKKITGLEDYQQAFLSVLFFTGCRVSEALALKADDITCMGDTIYIQFHRLKGSKQTDPQEIPKTTSLSWLCAKNGDLFPFCRMTAYRLVKKAFPNLYPHYFRMNRITWISQHFNDATVYHILGLSASAIDHYRAKVDIKRVSKALQEDIE